MLAVSMAAGLLGASGALATTPGQVNDFAGNGGANAPTPGPATSSRLYLPTDVAVDSSGNVYIADSINNVIEKVTPSGTLSIFAGIGPGNGGGPTPGPATSSDLNDPAGVAVDSSGNVYIADSGNDDVEKVTPSGTLSIFAGHGAQGSPNPGPATSSDFHDPSGVAVDSSGNVYIADTVNNDIEKVTPSGTLSIFAGINSYGAPTPGPATSSRLFYPYGLAIDSAGDLYIADSGNNRVEKVTASGTLSIFAGTGTAGAPTAGPATSSRLNNVFGVAVDSAGNVYIADSSNNRVEEVTSSGTLSIIAGTGSAAAPTFGGPATSSALNNPEGVAVDSAGDLYVADTTNNRIEVISPSVPANSTPPVISGTAAVGDTLSASPGTWSPTPTGYAYQWQDCNSSGTACAAITGATSSTYTVTSADAGSTIRVVVTAINSSGSASLNSTPTTAVTTPPLSTPTPTTPTTTTISPTTTTSTTTTTGDQADAVTVPAATVAAGLVSTGTGQVAVPLQCPAVIDGACSANGTLSVALNAGASELSDSIDRAAATGESVIAQFTGIQVEAGQQRLVATKLSAQTIAYLRAHDIYRVRVTLTIDNVLQSGQVVSSVQRMWLYVSALTGCHAASGTITASAIGSLKLGMTRARAHKTGHYTRTHNGFEAYCVAGGKTRVAYPSRSLIRSHRSLAHRVIIALTSNQHYRIHGIKARMTTKAARVHLHLGKPIVIGKNAWYLIRGAKATVILKVQRGVIREIGLTSRALTGTRAQDRYLLHHL